MAKLRRPCAVQGCEFVGLSEAELDKHVRASHTAHGTPRRQPTITTWSSTPPPVGANAQASPAAQIAYSNSASPPPRRKGWPLSGWASAAVLAPLVIVGLVVIGRATATETFNERDDYTWEVDHCDSDYGGHTSVGNTVDAVGVEGPIANLTDKRLKFSFEIEYTSNGADRTDHEDVIVDAGDNGTWSNVFRYEDDATGEPTDFWFEGDLSCNAVLTDIVATDAATTHLNGLPAFDIDPRTRAPAPAEERSAPSADSGITCRSDGLGSVTATGRVSNDDFDSKSMRIWVRLESTGGEILDTANDIGFDVAPGGSYTYSVLLESHGAAGPYRCVLDNIETQPGF